MIPDLDQLEAHTANADPDWLTITLRGIGEMHGDQTTHIPDGSRRWVKLSPWETDECGAPRAYVHLQADPADVQTWQAIDQSDAKRARHCHHGPSPSA
jgi:hypothetical protein